MKTKFIVEFIKTSRKKHLGDDLFITIKFFNEELCKNQILYGKFVDVNVENKLLIIETLDGLISIGVNSILDVRCKPFIERNGGDGGD